MTKVTYKKLEAKLEGGLKTFDVHTSNAEPFLTLPSLGTQDSRISQFCF